MPQRLVEEGKTVQISHHEFMHTPPLQPLARLGDKATALQKAGQSVVVGGRVTQLRRSHAGGRLAIVEPVTRPDTGLARAGADPRGNNSAGFTLTQGLVYRGTVGRQYQRARGGG